MSVDAVAIAEPERQFLFFRLGDDEVGLELHHVREILRFTPVTPVPGSPPWLAGVFNLRGKVLPVIDLAVRLGMPSRPVDKRTCIVILDLELGLAAPVPMGLVVDAVNRVDGVGASQVQPPPRFGLRVNADHVVGLTHRGDRMTVLLDVVRAFRDDELIQAARASEGAPAAAAAVAASPAPRVARPAEAVPAAAPGVAHAGATEVLQGLFLFDD